MIDRLIYQYTQALRISNTRSELVGHLLQLTAFILAACFVTEFSDIYNKQLLYDIYIYTDSYSPWWRCLQSYFDSIKWLCACTNTAERST